MLKNSWSKTGGDGGGESISQKIIGKVRPDEPLKNKIDLAQKKLQFQISKLDGVSEKLQKSHDGLFEKIVNAQKNNKNMHAHAYAKELSQVRKVKNMIGGAKLSMEADQTQARYRIRTGRCRSDTQSVHVNHQGTCTVT